MGGVGRFYSSNGFRGSSSNRIVLVEQGRLECGYGFACFWSNVSKGRGNSLANVVVVVPQGGDECRDSLNSKFSKGRGGSLSIKAGRAALPWRGAAQPVVTESIPLFDQISGGSEGGS